MAIHTQTSTSNSPRPKSGQTSGLKLSIKQKIWALPVLASVIFMLGLAVSATLATSALGSIRTTEGVDYPVLDAVKTIALDTGAIGDGLRDAVTEGDKDRIATVGEQASKLRA